MTTNVCVDSVVFHPGSGALGGAKKVDLDAVPQIGGQSLFEVKLDPDKPWKMPGQFLRCPVRGVM